MEDGGGDRREGGRRKEARRQGRRENEVPKVWLPQQCTKHKPQAQALLAALYTHPRLVSTTL